MISLRGVASRFTKRDDGDAFEGLACAHLERNGLVLVTRNWQCKQGEIDLVMREQTTLVFVEVRKRASMAFGGALASIDHGKRSRVERTVNAYLAQLPSRPAYRIDVVAFDGKQTPQWIKNAFA